MKVADPKAWAPDVISYNVFDTKSGRFIGTTYFDLFPRPGKFALRKLAAPAGAQARGWNVSPAGHRRLRQLAASVSRFARATLASRRHRVLPRVRAQLGGTARDCALRDAKRRIPSGFRRGAIADVRKLHVGAAVLKEVSSNVTTGAPLPDDLIAKMIAARYVDEAYFTLGQIKLGMVDMAYHSTGPRVDTTAVWAQISSEYTPLAMVPGTQPQASFGHFRLRRGLLQLFVGARVRARYVHGIQRTAG